MEVRLDKVAKKFGEITAVNEVSITFADRKLTTLLGPSGCGKTTTLRCISGFYLPDAGEVYLGEKLVNYIPPNRRDTITVFQTLAIFPHKTVGENVAYGLEIRKLPKKEVQSKVDEMLTLVGLKGFENRYPHQLSGGQQQRIALARSLIVEPKALLLDEPLSDLDAKLKVNMRTEIKKLQRELGITMIYVTHDQEEAMSISDYLVVMNDGKIEQIGPPIEVYQNPRTEFVAGFVGKANYISGTLTRIAQDEGIAFVKSPFGMFTIQTTNEEADESLLNKTVKMLIRPEEFALSDEKKQKNTISGKVVVAMFLGSVMRYEVDVGWEKNFIVDMPNPKSQEIRSRGDKLTLTVPKENLKLIW